MKEKTNKKASISPFKTIVRNILPLLGLVMFVNLILEILVTVFAALTVQDYFQQFLPIAILTVLVLGLEFLLFIFALLGYAVITDKLNWDSNKVTNCGLFLVLILIVSVFITGILIYTYTLQRYPLILDPFSLFNSSPLLALAFSVWWFFGFMVSMIILAIVVLVFLFYSD